MAQAEPRKKAKEADSDEGRGVLTPQMLVHRFASAVFGLCIANTKNLHDSEDIMQEVFVRAFEKLDTLKDPSRARPWLMKIARRMCIDCHRRRQTAQPIIDDIPAQPHYGSESIIRVHTAISKLPQKYREPIALYYLDGRKCAGVGETLGISEVAVRRRLVRARLMLHELLAEDKS